MAGSSEEQWRRDADMDDELELEEGEYVPGQGSHSPSDTTEYYNNYSSSESDDEATSNACTYFVATRRSDTGCSSSAVAASSINGYVRSPVAVGANEFTSSKAVMACRVCGKEFTSSKAVCGHMKVHALEHLAEQQGNGKEKEELTLVTRGWGVTGKRSSSASASGSRSVSPSPEPDSSMAIVIAEPDNKIVLEPTPLAYAATNLLSSSARVASQQQSETDTSGEGSRAQQVHDDAMAIVVAGSDPPPPSEAIAAHQAPPMPMPMPVPAAAPPVHRRRAARAAAGTHKPEGYTCGECGMWFRTNQALGGHAAAHRNRRVAAAAAGTHQDGAAPPCGSGGGSKQEKLHPCKECPAVFATGVQLGGHMRKHWKGDPIQPKKKTRLIEHLPLPPPPPADPGVPRLHRRADDDVTGLSLALPVEMGVQMPALPAVESVQPVPPPSPAEGTVQPAAPAPPATGRVLLFGIDIGPGVQRPRNREGSPATKESADACGPQ